MAKRAKQSFATPYRTRRGRANVPSEVVVAGQVLADDHPLVKAYPDKFVDVDVVEDATAAPGKVRATPKRKPAAKKPAAKKPAAKSEPSGE